MSISYTEFESEKLLFASQPGTPEAAADDAHGELKPQHLEHPFNSIAICMSGGGFRAASFSLGTLRYLRRIQFKDKSLLEHVKYISSASGGTITASCYAISQAKGEPFEEFYVHMVEALSGEKLLQKALRKLNDRHEWKGNKQRNLINAFAKTYDEEIYRGETFGTLYTNKSDLRVCFNATEFYRGLSFRFQNYGYIGNRYVNLKKERTDVTRKLKIADILAASSCFPAGFEPIEFPRDYTYDQLSVRDLEEIIDVKDYNDQCVANPSIPLMDGGIVDNQGLYSAVLADLNERRAGKPAMDLFIVTDVASYFMDHYEAPTEQRSLLGSLSFHLITMLSLVFGFGGAALSLYLLQHTQGFLYYLGAMLFAPTWITAAGFIANGLYAFINRFILRRHSDYVFLRNLLKLDKSFSNTIIDTLMHYLSRTRISTLQQMLKNRIGSMMTMVSDVNLKQIRRLINDIFYSNELFENRRCTNYIYEYSKQNLTSHRRRIERKKWSQDDKNMMLPNETMWGVAETARTMGTTLWFDKNDMHDDRLKTVIACGEFTVCGSLLEYILDLEVHPKAWGQLDEGTRQDILALKDRLKADWKKFKLDPLHLHAGA